MSLPFTIIDNSLLVGQHTQISFNRTLRVPEDGKHYDLPAGFGKLPIVNVSDVADRVPAKWREEGGLIIPLYQREALFLEFKGSDWCPTIAKVAVGRVNAITGDNYDLELRKGRQDYVVIPLQKWLDGINSQAGLVKQFVAMPLGQGYTVEAQATDEEEHGGFQICGYNPVSGVFKEPKPPAYRRFPMQQTPLLSKPARSQGADEDFLFGADVQEEMGIAAGGSIKQQIFEDTYGVEVWDARTASALNIHIVNSLMYESITGKPAPHTPITAEEYSKRKLPWYSYYEETQKIVSAPKLFKNIASIFQIDKRRKPGVSSAPVNFSQSPKIAISVKSLSERVNELNTQLELYQITGNDRALLYTAKTLGELLDDHGEKIKFGDTKLSSGTAAARVFTIAGMCCIRLNLFDEAEDYANRSLHSVVNTAALTVRMHARQQTGNLSGAKEDCEEILRIEPHNRGALQMKSQFVSPKE